MKHQISYRHKSKLREYWIEQGNISIRRFEVSAVGGLIDRVPPEIEDFYKICSIIEERARLESHTLVSTAVNEAAFLPIHLLEIGAKQSLSVCRIARYFSLEVFKEFIENVKQAISEFDDLKINFDSQEKVCEVFSIPKEIAEELFQKTNDRLDKNESTNNVEEEKQPLDFLANIQEHQLAKINPIPVGTGFLVGGSHLLTNHHVLPDVGTARQCIAQFNYVENTLGIEHNSTEYEFDTNKLFITEPRLDYTLVQLKSDMLTCQAGFKFGYLQLIQDPECIKPRLAFRINIEQTSRSENSNRFYSVSGEHKQTTENLEQFVLKVIASAPERNDQSTESLIQIIDSLKDLIGYFFAVTYKQKIRSIQLIPYPEKVNESRKHIKRLAKELNQWVSSEFIDIGLENSPAASGDTVIVIQHPKGGTKKVVLNRTEVTGLYKDYVRYNADSDYGSSGSPVFNTDWQLVGLHHAVIKREDSQFFSNEQQGIRICQIIDDLKKRSVSHHKLKGFLEDWVLTCEELSYPPLPTALKFDGEKCYIDCCNDVDRLKLEGSFTVELWIKNSDPGTDGVIVYRGGMFDADGYCIWRYANRIRVELRNGSNHIMVDTFEEVISDQSWHHLAFTWDRSKIDKKNWVPWTEKTETSERIVANLWQSIAGITIYIDGKVQCISTELNTKNLTSPNSISNRVEKRLTIGRSGSIEKNIDKLINKLNGIREPETKSFLTGFLKRPRTNLRLEVARQYYFNGLMTEIRLWKVAQNQEQIRNNMCRRLSKYDNWENLVGYWRPEEAVNNLVYNLKTEKDLEPLQISLDTKIDWKEQLPQLNFGLRLHGLHEYVDCGKLNYSDDHNEGIREITVESWIKNMGGDSDGIIIHQGGSWDENGFCIWRHKGKLRVELQDTNKQWKLVAETSDTFLDVKDNWFHIAFTWKSQHPIKIFINGKSQAINFLTLEKCVPFEEFSSIGTPKINLNIGRAQNHEKYLNAIIAEVRIWNKALEGDQIFNRMQSPLIQKGDQQPVDIKASWPDLLAYWPLNEEEGDRARNYASTEQYQYGIVFGRRWEKLYSLLNESKNRDYYGVVSKTEIADATQYPTLPLPLGLTFSGHDHFIEIQPGDDSIATKSITVEAWVKYKFGNCSIVSQFLDKKAKKNGYSLDLYEQKLRVTLQEDSETTVIHTIDNFPNDQLWHHIVFTVDSNEISIYIDARTQNYTVEGNSKTIVTSAKAKTIGLFSGSLKPFETSLYIGAKGEDTDYYNVSLAEVRLWKKARTQDQIKENMSRRVSKFSEAEQFSGLPSDWKSLLGYWRLDELSEDSTRVFNHVQNKYHGTLNGAVKHFPLIACEKD